MAHDMDDLLGDFLAESREHLDEIEPDLLEIERLGAETPSEVLNRIFRAIHSIKGASGFFSFEALKGLSHAMENVLMPIRDKILIVNPDIVDVLLRGIDKLRAMIGDIQGSDQVDCEQELTTLKAIIDSMGDADGAPAASDGPADPADPAEQADPVESNSDELHPSLDASDPRVRDVLTRGMEVYRVTVHPAEDLAAKDRTFEDIAALAASVGEVLAAPEAEAIAEAVKGDLAFSFMAASVLSDDLMPQAMETSDDRVETVDLSSIREQIVAERNQARSAAAAAVGPAARSTEGGEKAGSSGGGEKAPRHESPETVRVRVELLTQLMNSASELVLGRNQLLSLLSRDEREIPGLPPVLQNIDRTVSELQERVMQTRMQPIESLFAKFPRLARDLSRQTDKQVELVLEGSEVELDKTVLELLGDPLTHLVRNSIDHGIESPGERGAAGKSATGRVMLRAYHQGGQVNIEITDDGRGIDASKVAAKAIDKGLITAAQAEVMSQRDCLSLIFQPGLSTAAAVTEVSGRGVGMDVVRTNIEKLNGHIDVESVPGEGTTIQLQLPLTLAIIPALTVVAAGQRFAVPQANLVELVRIRGEEVKQRIGKVNDRAMLRLRGQLLPVVRLADVLGLHRKTRKADGVTIVDRRNRIVDRRAGKKAKIAGEDGVERSGDGRRNAAASDYQIVIIQVGATQFAMIVDEMHDSGETVVKPLSRLAAASGCFAGSTIMGDGQVILILDLAGVAERMRLGQSDKRAESAAEAPAETDGAAGTRQQLILFNHAAGELLAVSQEKLQRLERIDSAQIEQAGDQEYVQYRGAGLPVLRLDRHLPLRPLPSDAEELYLVIPKRAGRPAAGLLASRIVDAVDVNVNVQPAGEGGFGLQGTAVVDGRLALFVDPELFLDAALQEKVA